MESLVEAPIRLTQVADEVGYVCTRNICFTYVISQEDVF